MSQDSVIDQNVELLRTAYEARVRALEVALRERERELAILSALAARIHGVEDEQAILEIALDELLAGLQLPAAWIFMGDQAQRVLRLAAARGVSETYLSEVRTQGLGECLCPEVFWNGHTMLARNTTQCPRMPHIVDGSAAPTAHACIPLRFEGAMRGVLNLAALPGQLFTPDELRFLETIGHQICIAVERARHLRAEAQRNQEARALATINRAIGGSLDVPTVLRAVGETARELMGADRVHVLLGSDPRRMAVAHLSGLPHPELHERDVLDLVALDARLHQQALHERRALAVDDSTTDSRANRDLARRWDMASTLIVPLLGRDRPLGVMTLVRTVPQDWTETQMDVTEALAMQATVAMESARLYEDLRGAYHELKDAQTRIIQSEKMAVLGTFASGLAHEIRNPLNSIGLQISILERRTGGLPADAAGKVRDLIGIIREEVKRLDSLVGDFLLFSRTSRIQHRAVNVGALAEEVVQLLGPEAAGMAVALRRQAIGREVPEIRVDAERVKQVLINLVRNAIEALPEGGEVVVEDGLVDGRACLRVRDNGPGLPQGLDVFQLFVTTKPQGTGLGLSIVQQIVQEHGGEVVATSEPGKGATFTVWLPLTQPE